jgi:DNA repair protein RadC
MINEVYKERRNIKEWAEDDRPREKLRDKGASALSNAELIAILIASGTKKKTAVDVAKEILDSVENDFYRLLQKTIKDLQKYDGIGEAKAITIYAALELGRRIKKEIKQDRHQIKSSQDVHHLMEPDLLYLTVEEFWILHLNKANFVKRREKISSGGMSGTVADPKIIFKSALAEGSAGIILVHNHPSGNKNPSDADRQLTQKLKEAGHFLDLPIIDHLIFTDHGSLSFRDEGIL